MSSLPSSRSWENIPVSRVLLSLSSLLSPPRLHSPLPLEKPLSIAGRGTKGRVSSFLCPQGVYSAAQEVFSTES